MRAAVVWVTLLISSLAHARGAAVDPAEKPVRDFLARQKTIRLFVDEAAGMGHQSASARLLERLRQLGFAGEVEIVFTSTMIPKIMFGKMAALFPGFRADGPEIQDVRAYKTKFMTREAFDNERGLETVDLALTGAEDYMIPLAEAKARMFLSLQPLGWTATRQLRIAERGGEREILLPEMIELGQRFDPSTLPVSLQYANGVSPGLNPAKWNGLREIFFHRQVYDSAVYYGHGLYLHTSQLENYVNGIHLAQLNDPHFAKGVVIPIFMDLERDQIEAIEHALAKPEILKGAAQYVEIGDRHLGEKLRALARGKILLVHVGMVPHDLFAYFMTNSTIAPIVGGRNSIDLMAKTGKPYLTSNPREGFHFTLEGHRTAVGEHAEALATAHDAEYVMNRSRADDLTAGDVEKFLSEAKDPRSPVSQLFSSQKMANDVKADQVVQGLLVVVQNLPTLAERLRERVIFPLGQICDLALSKIRSLRRSSRHP